MFKAYKYRIYPTGDQIANIEATIGCCRLVYNLALQVKKTAYKDAGVNISKYDLCKQLTELKKEYTWLHQADSQSLQYSVKMVEASFKKFFDGKGYPKFKKKTGKQVFHCPNGKRVIDFNNQLLHLPKIKNIPIIISREFDGKIKDIVISKTPTGKYFSCFIIDTGIEPPTKKLISKDNIVGIDVGLRDFAILSNGERVSNPKFFINSSKRLACLQRRFNRKIKGGNNRKKAAKKVSICHEKISNKRQDFLHKISSVITKQYDTIVVEDLNISGMIKSKKLSKAISDVSWGEFYRQLSYKSDWNGSNFLQVPRFYASSKLCSYCGAKNETLKLSDSEWTCANCGEIHDRDKNASINIEHYFITNSPMGNRGEPVELSALSEAMKQENKAKT